MTRRAGLSLIEVLAAIFIMGIGLISLFTLFPYGAIQMASAVKDDRTAQSAAAADAFMRVYWKAQVLEGGAPNEAFTAAMDDPNSDPQNVGFIKKPTGPVPPGVIVVPALSATVDQGPSYPVFVDSMGWVARVGRADQAWVADGGPQIGLIPRRTLFAILQEPALKQATLSLRLCSLLDGLTYAQDGRAAEATGVAAEDTASTVQRELRYNWLWVLQRPNNADRSSARMTVVVFDKRAHLFAPNSAEQTFQPSFAAIGQTAISFPSGSEPPGLKKGAWLLDATITTFRPTGAPPNSPPISAVRNANFYRVVSVTENGGSVDVELHQPLKPDSKTPGAPDATFGERRFVLLSGIADVFEKNPLGNSTAGP